jgi:hypothetical protein
LIDNEKLTNTRRENTRPLTRSSIELTVDNTIVNS